MFPEPVNKLDMKDHVVMTGRHAYQVISDFLQAVEETMNMGREVRYSGARVIAVDPYLLTFRCQSSDTRSAVLDVGPVTPSNVKFFKARFKALRIEEIAIE